MAETISMPKLGFDMQEGTLVRWVRLEGEAVEKGQVLAEIETDKATVEVESTASGVVFQHLVEQGSIVPVGTPIVIIAAPGEKVEKSAQAKPEKASEAVKAADSTLEKPAASPAGSGSVAESAVSPSGEDGGRVKVSPLARKMASDSGLNLVEIKGSGPGGRVVRKDIEAVLAAPKVAVPVPQAQAPAKIPMVSVTSVPGDQHIPLDKLRTIIGKRLVESKQQVPHFYVTHNYNVEPMLALRSKVNELLPEDQKITVNDFIVKAVALTLRQFPNVNASLNGTEIIRHGHVNVGVAVALEGGLMTVVSKDTDQKPLRQISVEMREMVARARQGKVRPDDIEGSTFSISNMGMYDVEYFTAIINPPEAAILAVGSAMKVPVVEGDQVKIGTRMRATLSADHRVTDGAEAARFLQMLATFLENPLRLLV
jgi:pyruvate dehydrogenase E2 component (dihydrolipoamide acetyltransferase)